MAAAPEPRNGSWQRLAALATIIVAIFGSGLAGSLMARGEKDARNAEAGQQAAAALLRVSDHDHRLATIEAVLPRVEADLKEIKTDLKSLLRASGTTR